MADARAIPEVFHSRKELIEKTRERLIEEIAFYKDKGDTERYEQNLHAIARFDKTSPGDFRLKLTPECNVELYLGRKRFAIYYRELCHINFHIGANEIPKKKKENKPFFSPVIDWEEYYNPSEEDRFLLIYYKLWY